MKALAALKFENMTQVPDLSHHSALRMVFEKYSHFPTGSDLWTDRSKIVTVTGSDNGSSYGGKVQK